MCKPKLFLTWKEAPKVVQCIVRKDKVATLPLFAIACFSSLYSKLCGVATFLQRPQTCHTFTCASLATNPAETLSGILCWAAELNLFLGSSGSWRWQNNLTVRLNCDWIGLDDLWKVPSNTNCSTILWPSMTGNVEKEKGYIGIERSEIPPHTSFWGQLIALACAGGLSLRKRCQQTQALDYRLLSSMVHNSHWRGSML